MEYREQPNLVFILRHNFRLADRVGASADPVGTHTLVGTVPDPDPVGTHRSSLYKDAPLRGAPSLDEKQCILRTHRKLTGQLGNTRVWPYCTALLWAAALGRTRRLASLAICFSQSRQS